MVRGADGELQVASWREALEAAAAGLRAATAAGVLVGGRVSVEDAYAYGKFARTVLGTNDIDFRARPHSAEEADFLASSVVATGPDGGAVTYADLESAGTVVLVGLEPEDESPIVFLRLRKAFRKHRTAVYAVAPFATRGLAKVGGTLIPTAPGTEPEVLRALGDGSAPTSSPPPGQGLRDNAVVLVGERLATVPGALCAAAALAEATGARLAWVPRRAGERGALEAGALPTLLPGGRPVADSAAREQVADRLGRRSPARRAAVRDTAGILAAAATGAIDALVVGGVDPADLADPRCAEALASALRRVAGDPSLGGHRGRRRRAPRRGRTPRRPAPSSTGRAAPAPSRRRSTDRPGQRLPRARHARRRDGRLPRHPHAARGARRDEPSSVRGRARAPPPRPSSAGDVPSVEAGTLVLATWHHLLDRGSLQDGEPFLAGTAPAPFARVSASTAGASGSSTATTLTVRSATRTVTAPVLVSEMADHVVWLPTNSVAATCAPPSPVRRDPRHRHEGGHA